MEQKEISSNHTNGNRGPGARPTANPSGEEQDRSRWVMVGVIVGGVVLLALLVGAVIFLLQPDAPTERIRDIFIIFMALISVLLGLALIVLILQLASLLNLLQNEIKPIIASTNETVNTLRGTTVFISDNLAGPVIKLNEYLAAVTSLFRFQRLIRKR
jgi:hypothetical protein